MFIAGIGPGRKGLDYFDPLPYSSKFQYKSWSKTKAGLFQNEIVSFPCTGCPTAATSCVHEKHGDNPDEFLAPARNLRGDRLLGRRTLPLFW